MDMKRHAFVTLGLALALGASACGSTSTGAKEVVEGATITLVTHDSFAVSDGVLDAFTKQSGIKVTVAKGKDAGVMVNEAVLTKGKPVGDVLWGTDNTLLSRAVKEKIFVPYKSPELGTLNPAAVALVPGNEATPVDLGDVCINTDTAYFAGKNLAVPSSLDDLADPKYKDLFVVPSAATSSPGLAFMLATVAKYGPDKYVDYWKKLRANGVKIVDGWTTAYTVDFSGSSGKGSRPIVVSYGSSPPSEVSDPAATTSPTAVMESSCFRQVEFVGILAGTKHRLAAQKLIDFLLTDAFQADMPGQMYVFPARTETKVPDAWAKFAVLPKTPLVVAPADIATNRDKWIKQWNDAVLG
jgi:thiamine transport system substrate-binding protein